MKFPIVRPGTMTTLASITQRAFSSRVSRLGGALCAVMLAASCGGGSGETVAIADVDLGNDLRSADVIATAPVVLTGRVTLAGEVPTPDSEWDVRNDRYCSKYQPIKTQNWSVGENKALADVVIAIVGQSGGSVDPRPAFMDQAGCCYDPHVVAVAAGEGVVFKNSDQTFHNVRIDAHKMGTFDKGASIKNYGQPADSTNLHKFPAAGVYRVECDLHRWMRSWVYVHDSGFYAVSQEDGTFAIHGELPDGDYEVIAWHSQFAEPLRKSLRITGGSAELDFEFDASQAMLPAHQNG
ncbi:cupredoxin domain-containing protein [Sulfuriroseicoccus oceanibius]|uniref:Blue (type 1) copper domain-containing protein n=1 Tax=Sulfuriroseicoccus oceanibius TaxID=2707525 RepID=A0A6B3LB27_9BACT|nr:plastocyanin/azurin family copper-binding protein [Sulfuriroseicoccus oceanibius]QQL44631.1 hypothetical protein G3M56_012180 [Sulfuriroseicoccus oceanibius]